MTSTSVAGVVGVAGVAGLEPGAVGREATVVASRRADRPGHRHRPRAYLVAVAAIVVGAGLLRAVGLTSGLPYSTYVDEGFVLRPAAVMAVDRTWDPGWYNYPSLLIELTAVGITGFDVVASGVGGDLESTAATDDYSAVFPGSLILTGRLLVWTFSTATVLLTIIVGSRLAGRRVGLVAGVLVGVVPALVSRSSVVIVDTPATFFVMASVLAATSLGRARRPMVVAAAAGALAGLAMTSKYPSAAVILVVGTVIAVTPTSGVRRKLLLGVTSVGAAAVAVIVTMPALVLRTGAVADALRRQAQVYAVRTTETGYLRESLNGAELGWWLVLPAAVGVGLLVHDRRSRAVAVGWLAFATAMVLAVSRTDFQPFRNLIPLVPFLTIGAAMSIVALVRVVRTALPAGDRAPSGAWSVALTALLTTALAGSMVVIGVVPALGTSAGIVDSRTKTVDWLAATVLPDQRVLVAGELFIAPEDLRRIPGQVVVAPSLDGATFDWSSYDYIVTGLFREAQPNYELAYGSTVAVTFGTSLVSTLPNLGRRVDQQIQVRRPR